MLRRNFLKHMGLGATTALAWGTAGAAQPNQQRRQRTIPPTSYEQWIAARVANVITTEYVDSFLDPKPNNQWGQFDPELGYVTKDCLQQNGIDGCFCIYRYDPSGARHMINFADRPCRINTYGDSFTQCQQVSDGESWQEYLAAHLGEPIRNFGVGGHGVFQAYRRMLRVEDTDFKAANIILNIYGDDHHRSLMPWRTFLINFPVLEGMFHGNPWSYLAVNLTTGEFEERPNPCPTPESLYNLCSADYVVKEFGPSPIFQLHAMMDGVADVEQGSIQQLADWADYKFDFSDVASRRTSATTLFDIMAYKSTLHLLDGLMKFAQAGNRNVLVLLSHPGSKIAKFVAGEPRNEYDTSVINYLEEHKIPYLDCAESHKKEFEQFSITPAQYVKRYFIGHYNPQGNHFFAYAIKDTVADWLDPKPITYQENSTIMRFNEGRSSERP